MKNISFEHGASNIRGRMLISPQYDEMLTACWDSLPISETRIRSEHQRFTISIRKSDLSAPNIYLEKDFEFIPRESMQIALTVCTAAAWMMLYFSARCGVIFLNEKSVFIK
ncbi:MAG: hypothetical protein FJ161_03805 [Gammaproteobacteria bacterium]|nr:hypothetical protein [Gammaproteobacteria bacterium]